MAKEIERKYLVRGEAWKALATGVPYRQGYLSVSKKRTVRVRVAGERGFITVKGPSAGIARTEFEYEIPLADADQMLDELCLKPLIEKLRYCVPCREGQWEIDEFFGENSGLVVAEIELTGEEDQVDLPDWIEREVSDDPRYFNSNLIIHPFQKW